MENTVTLNRNEYDLLVQKALKYDQVVTHIFEIATYEKWDKNHLNISGAEVDNTLSVIEPIKYKNRLDTLKQEKEAKDNVTTSE